MDMNMRIEYLVVCVRMWMCGCGCGCTNAIEYLHIRLFACGIFYGVMPMQCTKLDAHVMICMCGCLDSVADMRMHASASIESAFTDTKLQIQVFISD